MTLRARIAAVAALAVALAVVATAVFTYVAVRSSLRGEIDDSLTSRASGLAGGGGGGGSGRAAGGPRGRRRPPPPVRNGPPAALLQRGREFQRRLAPRAEPFGGQGAYAQFISADGDVLRPPGRDAGPARVRRGAQRWPARAATPR